MPVVDPQHHFGCAIKSALNVRVRGLVFKAGTPEIDELDVVRTGTRQKNVFWLDVAVHDADAFQILKRMHHLPRYALNDRHV